ncbi:MAG: gluconolactonase [Actinomycetia bacterium]|nr:gluconolactonase [Actinomycetes bacterium]
MLFAGELHLPECPRWHDGALWLSDMWAHQVLRFDADGTRHVERTFPEDDDPGGLGWLPDGRLLVAGMESRIVWRFDGEHRDVHADLRDLSPFQLNDMVVDEDGTAWVTQFGWDMWGGGSYADTVLVRVSADGDATVVAEGMAVPNGIAVRDTDLVVAEPGAGRISSFTIDGAGLRDRRTIALPVADGAAHVTPDGLCLDAEGGIWTADPLGHRVLHLGDGEVDTIIPVPDGSPLACVLGGPDRRTLFVCVGGQHHKPTRTPEPTGRVLTFEADVPGEGRP